MLGLIIVLSFLPVRRVTGQSTVVYRHEIVGSQALLSAEDRPEENAGNIFPSSPPPAFSANEPTSDAPESSGLNLTHPAVKHQQPNPLFISHTASTMSPPKHNSTVNQSSTDQTMDLKDKIFFEDDDADEKAPGNCKTSPNKDVNLGSSTLKPVVPALENSLNVTELDERSSFDGDACPTGQVKVNGMCVPKD